MKNNIIVHKNKRLCTNNKHKEDTIKSSHLFTCILLKRKYTANKEYSKAIRTNRNNLKVIKPIPKPASFTTIRSISIGVSVI